jgi:DNA-binding NarL/FixJ family response regulator
MTNPKITRVVLADDHAKIRAGIRSLLQNTSDIVVVGEARDGQEALEMVKELAPDVLVLDMEMPLMNGSEVAARLQRNASPVHILALSAYDDRQYILSMLNNGAAGYLTKDEVPDTLVIALRGVAQGQQGWISRRLADKFAISNRLKNQTKVDIVPEEMEIFHLLASKKSLRDLAGSLGISENEADAQIRNLQSKLNLNSRAELVLLAINRQAEAGAH